MARLREFRRRLDAIERKLSAEGPRALRRSPARMPSPVSLESACPGEVTDVPGSGRAYVMTDPEGRAEQARELRRLLSLPGSPMRERILRGSGVDRLEPEDLLFVDIETTGLGSTPLFLIGALVIDAESLSIRQYLARDYAEERAALDLFGDELRRRRLLVSFNGKSFDLPYIRVRLAYHREPPLPELPHFDVLHEARRIWRGSVPDCRLKTLEETICGHRREGDIDGAAIPEAYHRFVRTGDAAEIERIVMHNRLDLLTMADLLQRMPALT